MSFITVTFQFDSLQSLHDFTASSGLKFCQEVGAVVESAPALVPGEPTHLSNGYEMLPPKKRGRPPKVTAGPDAPTADPLSLDDVAPTAMTVAKEATIDDVRAVLMSFNSKHGLKALGEKLKAEFGVSGMKGLKASQYADVVKSFTP